MSTRPKAPRAMSGLVSVPLISTTDIEQHFCLYRESIPVVSLPLSQDDFVAMVGLSGVIENRGRDDVVRVAKCDFVTTKKVEN